MKKLDVLYTTNEAFLDITLASCLSLIENGNIEEINLRIITENVSISGFNKIKDFVLKYNNVNLFLYPLEFFDIEKYNLPEWRGTQIANARLFFREILGSDLEGVTNLLYLDSDTIVVGSLDGLEKYNDDIVCACKDDILLSDLERLNLDTYYNSGVLYINPVKWIENECDLKILYTLLNNNYQLNYPDQDLLNLALSKDITELTREYNFGPIMGMYNSLGNKLYFKDDIRLIKLEEIIMAQIDPKILHSYGLLNIKPWTNNSVNPFNEVFRKYLKIINPDFELSDSDTKFKFLVDKPQLVKLLALSRTCCPTNLSKMLVKIKKRLENN